MRRSFLIILVFFVISFLAFYYSLLSYQRALDKEIVELKRVSFRPMVFLNEDVSYRIGYDEGYNNFLIQTGRENLVVRKDMGVVYSYAVDNSVDLEDAKNRGYVDGYHRACEIFDCPR